MPSKTLFLLRHAKSDWNIEVIDFLRPLKKRGIRDATIMGQWMLSHRYIPELIICSPAERTLSTAKKIRKAMALDKSIIRTDERIYNASAELLKTVLQACPEDIKTVLLIGHNPSLEELLTDLVETPITLPDDDKLLPTTALAQLEFEGTWQELASNSACLKALTRVKSLYETEA